METKPTFESFDDFLEHHGVMGMKWGVRRTREQLAGRSSGTKLDKIKNFGRKTKETGSKAATKVTGPQKVSLSKDGSGELTARGGKRQGPTEDAIKTAVTKQKAKMSSTDAISTKDLQDLVNRMNLEQQYAKLTTPAVKPKLIDGRKIASEVLSNTLKGVVMGEITAKLAGKPGPISGRFGGKKGNTTSAIVKESVKAAVKSTTSAPSSSGSSILNLKAAINDPNIGKIAKQFDVVLNNPATWAPPTGKPLFTDPYGPPPTGSPAPTQKYSFPATTAAKTSFGNYSQYTYPKKR